MEPPTLYSNRNFLLDSLYFPKPYTNTLITLNMEQFIE